MGRSVYATIEDVRRAGVPDNASYPDDRVLDLLELASEIVENLTQQVFGPTYKQFDANGSGRRIIEEEDRNKIIDLFQIVVLRHGLLRRRGFLSENPVFLVRNDDYTLHERYIRLRANDTSSSPFRRAFRDLRDYRFANDERDVRVDGVFGWLDLSTKHETTLTQDLAFGATTIRVLDTGDIERNDLLLVDRRFWVIVKAIAVPSTPATETDPAVQGEITIDPAPKSARITDPTVPPAVARYGKVPRLVREATVRTFLAHSFAPGSGEEIDAMALNRIRREETDNYELELFAAPGSDRVNTGTGDARADAFLSQFRAPTVTARYV